MHTYSPLFTDTVRVAVTCPTNPTGTSVRFAFTNPLAQPVSGDWVAGTWEPTQLSTGEWVADCTIGPSGAKTLPVGEYTVWVALGATVGSGWGEAVTTITVD